MIPIIVPTYKPLCEIGNLLFNINSNISKKRYVVIPTCINACAATNRNYGLMLAEKYCSDIIIMVDDDIAGFYKNWADSLIEPLLMTEHKSCVMVSARLMQDLRTTAIMMDHKPDLTVKYQIVQNALPSAAIVFRCDKLIRFDEAYSVDNKGASWEDTDFAMQYNKKYPECYYIINNNCKLIHKNEQKYQNNYRYFEQIFREKWSIK